MDQLVGASGRAYIPLPIDGGRGFPQAFPLVFANHSYRFRLYVNASTLLLGDKSRILDLPTSEAFLVVQVELEPTGGIQQPIFIRKVVPALEYETEKIALIFPQQRVAVQNLNGQGNFGSRITGGIALR